MTLKPNAYAFVRVDPRVDAPGCWAAVVRNETDTDDVLIYQVWDDWIARYIDFQTKEAAEAAGRCYRENMIEIEDDRQEIANEEGMLQGVDAYNELLGSPLDKEPSR